MSSRRRAAYARGWLVLPLWPPGNSAGTVPSRLASSTAHRRSKTVCGVAAPVAGMMRARRPARSSSSSMTARKSFWRKKPKFASR
ncbi:hypothetical protein [Nonomuraea maheshkhaliensis]|uniref:hypothetical protein n=1 Tax=Nonomuraea maheshkhaliensis TaxID=419590 RepID=UPI0031F81BF3